MDVFQWNVTLSEYVFFTNHIAWWEKAIHFSRFYTRLFWQKFWSSRSWNSIILTEKEEKNKSRISYTLETNNDVEEICEDIKSVKNTRLTQDFNEILNHFW